MGAIKIGEGKSSYVKNLLEIVLAFARIVEGKPVDAERDHISSRIRRHLSKLGLRIRVHVQATDCEYHSEGVHWASLYR